MAEARADHSLFLLSPANCGGERAGLLRSPRARFALARELQSERGATLGDVFSFLSSLYFRGKLAYSRRFARAPERFPDAFVITPGRGLRPATERIRLADLEALAAVEVDAKNEAHSAPLRRDADALVRLAPASCRFILLGSIATAKYVDPLLEACAERLLFPAEFVGRGDMSRGGLLLRCAREGRELEYVPVASAVRRGRRATRIGKLDLWTKR